MSKHRRYAFWVGVSNPDNYPTLWFQGKQLTPNPNLNKAYSSLKGFRTQKKFVTFLRYVTKTYPNAFVQVLERRHKKDYIFSFPVSYMNRRK